MLNIDSILIYDAISYIVKLYIGIFMGMSGINGGNCILSNMAKGRVEQGWFDGAYIKGSDSSYIVYFEGNNSEWNGEPLVLSSSRNPYEPRIFKSIDGAVSELKRIGIMQCHVILTE